MKKLLIIIFSILIFTGCEDKEFYRITVQYESCTTGKIGVSTVEGFNTYIDNSGAVPALWVSKSNGGAQRIVLNVCDYKILKKEEIK